MEQKKIEDYLKANRKNILDDITRLVAIDSGKGEAEPGKPYGPGPAAALECAMALARDMGFAVKDYDHAVCAVDLNEKETQLDILAHLDIVPAGDGWNITQPFCAVEQDGKLYGRGTADDKGPAVAALYAMKAVRDLGIPLKKNVRLLLGTDEECGSSDLACYYGKEAEAPMSFSPDADFPLINTEKGRLSATFGASFAESAALPRVVCMDGGTRTNVVPNLAQAWLEGMPLAQAVEYCASLATGIGAKFSAFEEQGHRVRIACEGVGAHASRPQAGVNAITALLTLLSRMPMAQSEGFAHLCAVTRVFAHGDWLGTAAGVAMHDALSGELTISLNVLHATPTGLVGTFDCRAPLCATNENLRDVLAHAMQAVGLSLSECSVCPGHHVPADSPLVQILLQCYEQYTGKQGQCLAIGGGTYVHHLKNGVAFGCAMPGTDNHMHGADEFIVVDDLLTSAMIFAQAIVNICT